MASYYHHDIGDDLTLQLRLHDPNTGDPVVGANPTVAIRRHREANGGAALDDWYWNGSVFLAAETLLPLSPQAGSAGQYLYQFEQTLIGLPTIYLVRFVSTTPPALGFDDEEHIFDRKDVIVVEAEPSQ